MKKRMWHNYSGKRLLSLALAVVMVFGILPLNTRAEVTAEEYTVDSITTEADNQTLGRPGSVYGDNTLNAGKVTVGKSVHNGEVVISYGNGKTQKFTPGADNFIITSSQAAQVVGLASESAAPVDVVFVLDTSASMNNGRATSMVTATNKAIASLMAANKDNRVGVVAFSGTTSSLGAANQLSALAHYDDVDANNDGDLNDANDVSAASNHLRWGSSNGTVSNNGSYIIGRGTNAGVRQGVNGGTNIHAGIALGAQMLTNATSTTVLIDGKSVTRMPFLVVLSDGAPTFSSSSETWYTPAMSSEQGPGSSYYSGNGFLAALTAAYYKGKITEHYYGNNASENNRCYVYTIGVGLESLSDADAKALAQITMDPDTYTNGTYAAANAASWWNYGRTHNEDTKETTHGWKAYWDSFQKASAADFDVEIENGSWQNVWVGQGEEGSGQPQYSDFYDDRGRFDWNAYQDAYNAWTEANYERKWIPTTFTITANTITAAKNYVNGLNASGAQMYNGGIAYNDDYFTAEETGEIEAAFNKAIHEIQLQAMAAPTRVEDSHGADFSGYVTYTDPIGEYMEVKKVFGLIAGGNYYQGKSFAQYMQNWNNGTTQTFKDNFLKILKERCRVTGAALTDAKLQEIIAKAVASDNQAYYKSDADYDNSFTWWGKSYIAEGDEDIQIQILDFAEDDSIAYITDPDTTIPTGADYVCRSYYFYGTAGGTVQSDSELMHFVVRVQRSLKAPYQETVVISAPASLLSMEKVLITEKTDAQGEKTYSATVTKEDPARVVYEVGLRSDINAFSVDQILKQDAAAGVNGYDYAAEKIVEGGQTRYPNYDEATDTYHFYTNDWNRQLEAGETEHHRAMTHATFDAATDNAFYTYTKDTPIYTKNGDTYTLYNGSAKPSGIYYYAREYYDWTGATPTNNTYAAQKKTAYILVDIPSSSDAVKKGTDSWYIAKGAYKASSLSTSVEEVPKTPNRTGTSEIVVHPHRTESENNSHYTVLLGNNGKLSLKSVNAKSVDLAKAGENSVIADADGRVVMVGDTLIYRIQVINGETTTADAVVTDKIPVGTAYVDGSASEGGSYDSATKTITWNIKDIPAGHFVEVSFKVVVTEEALTGDKDVATINNQAYVKLENGFEYRTNTTKNPPEGKKVVDTNGAAITGSVDVPDVLVYRIRWHNDSGSVATVKITDVIPAGTTYVENSASDPANVTVENGKIVWTFENVQPGTNDVVSFRVSVNATAGNTIENGAQIQIGNNNPRVTNKTSVPVAKGNLSVTKTVNGYPSNLAEKTFSIKLTEVSRSMTGTYKLLKNGTEVDGGIAFSKGIATVSLKNGETATIVGIPAGTVISVTEDAPKGFTPSYNPAATESNAEGRVTIAENTTVGVAVTNTYAVTAVEFKLSAKKKLDTSFDVAATTFGFTAYSCNEQGVVDATKQPLTGEVTVSSTAKEAEIVFAPVTYSSAGTYYYLISEINGGVSGIQYTTAKYIVQVDVTDDGSGQLNPTQKLIKKHNGTGFVAVDENDSLTFTNTYLPAGTSLVLTGTKVLTGRGLQDNEFSFTVKDSANKTVASGFNTDTDDTDTLYNNIVFSPISYEAEDMGGANTKEFTYIVTEDQGTNYGVSYSQESYRLTVTVTNNSGKLSAAITKWEKHENTSYVEITEETKKSLTFTNVFTPDDIGLTLSGTKTMVDAAGNKLELIDQQFGFLVEQQDAEGNWHRVTSGNNTAVNTDKVYQIGFSSIYYDLADLGGAASKTFTYRIRELIPEGPSKDPNMDYDDAVFTVTVTLSQDANGHLQLTTPVYSGPDNATAVAFKNVKYPGTISVVPQAFKYTYTNRQTQTGANEVPNVNFSFEVLDKTNGVKITEGVGSANPNPSEPTTPNVTFGAIVFDNNDAGSDHWYIIRESHRVAEPVHGILHDLTEYAMKVTVSRSDAGELSAVVTYYSYANNTVGAEIGTAVPTFVNEYHAKGYWNMTAVKNLVDVNGAPVNFQGKTFNFQMQRVNSATNLTPFAGDAEIYEGISNASGVFNFGTLYYDQNAVASGNTAVRYYKITEVNPRTTTGYGSGYPGVKYDDTTYVVGVQLSNDGSGNIATSIVEIYKNGVLLKNGETNLVSMDNIVFANTYQTEAGTSAAFVATKLLEGRDLREGEFRFDLFYVDGNNVEHLVDTAYNMDTNRDGVYDDVYFIRNYPASTPKNTYNYIIKESKGNQSTVGYDQTTVGKVTVTIGEDTENAALTSSVAYPDGSITFTNTYTPKGTALVLEGTKVLNNRAPKDREFAFDILKVVGNDKVVVGAGHNTDTDGDGKFEEIKFTDLHFTPADMWDSQQNKYLTEKQFQFVFVEIAGTDHTVTYSKEEYELTVTVKDEAGQLTIASVEWKKRDDASVSFSPIEAGTELVFNNTYRPRDISLQLHAGKVLVGHDMKDGTFSFLIHDITDETNPKLVASGGNKAATVGNNGQAKSEILFSNIGYTIDDLSVGAERTYIYEITEQATTHGGVSIDETPYYAKVVLSLDTQSGELAAVVTYHSHKSCTAENKIDDNGPVFTNRYEPAAVEVEIYADKTLINKKLEAEEFTFTLTGDGVNQSKTNNANGRVTFDKLTFSAPGTYRYTLSESVTNADNASNYTLDHSFQVIVKVEDDLRGNLVATVDYHEIKADGQIDPDTHLGGAEFINYYTAPPVTVNLTEQIGATKTVKTPDGVVFSKAGFKFQVTDAAGKIIKGWSNGAELDMIGVSDADGKISFPSFYFATAGEYHYWITEQQSGIQGMTDDPRTWELHILVRYNEETGVLEVHSADVKTYPVGRTVSEANKPEFVNIFNPVPVKLSLEATKLLEGREMKDREFLFYLMKDNIIVAQAHNDVDGKVTFDLVYTAEDIGTHAYTIKEAIPEKTNNGITYDGTTHVAVTVGIGYDTTNRKLVASVNNTPIANDAAISTGVTITNKYTTEAATAQIVANKVITANRVLKDKEFTFCLKDSEGKIVATAQNDAAGWIAFHLPYDKAGTYTYEMFEQTGDDQSLVYDNTRYKVTVTVTDDQMGKLHAVVAYDKDAVPTFVNEYRALSTTATITAKKILKGNKTLAAGDFTFELEREDGAKVTVKNTAEGLALFAVRFDKAGIYTYTLREQAGNAAGVTYDDAEYKVIVTVTDDREGKLHAAVAYEGLAAGETMPSFVNTYEGKAASVQITANKTLSGKALTAGAFDFTLTNKDNAKDVYTVKNDDKGNVVFDLKLTEVGTYTYILAEATGVDANVTYDKTAYTVTVKVTDDLQGSLKAEVAYDTTDGKAPVFKNTYTPSAITVELTGQKKLSGRDLKKEEFKFEVRDSEGNVVATAKNDADGKLVFSAITLKTAGKYVFTVTEVKGGIKGMIYDTTAHEVTVEVVNDNGQLKATVSEPKGGLVFQNTYKEPDPSNPGTGDDMPLLLLIGLMVISAGAVVVLLVSRKKRNG